MEKKESYIDLKFLNLENRTGKISSYLLQTELFYRRNKAYKSSIPHVDESNVLKILDIIQEMCDKVDEIALKSNLNNLIF